jgi:hypothetical protein
VAQTHPDTDLETLDWMLAEALDAHWRAKALADAAGKTPPLGALRLGAQLHHRRLLLTGRLPMPGSRKKGPKNEAASAHSELQRLEQEVGIGVAPQPTAPHLHEPAQPLEATNPTLTESPPTKPNPSHQQPVCIARPEAPAQPQPGPNRRQRRQQARLEAKALRRQSAKGLAWAATR